MVERRGSFDALFIFRFGTVLYIYLKVSNPSFTSGKVKMFSERTALDEFKAIRKMNNSTC